MILNHYEICDIAVILFAYLAKAPQIRCEVVDNSRLVLVLLLRVVVGLAAFANVMKKIW